MLLMPLLVLFDNPGDNSLRILIINIESTLYILLKLLPECFSSSCLIFILVSHTPAHHMNMSRIIGICSSNSWAWNRGLLGGICSLNSRTWESGLLLSRNGIRGEFFCHDHIILYIFGYSKLELFCSATLLRG